MARYTWNSDQKLWTFLSDDYTPASNIKLQAHSEPKICRGNPSNTNHIPGKVKTIFSIPHINNNILPDWVQLLFCLNLFSYQQLQPHVFLRICIIAQESVRKIVIPCFKSALICIIHYRQQRRLIIAILWPIFSSLISHSSWRGGLMERWIQSFRSPFFLLFFHHWYYIPPGEKGWWKDGYKVGNDEATARARTKLCLKP